mmetsp:Transcript_23953/g.57797  ORF Transcript_23953/g.57797 Transcript_23953/m.57797 type:complete len:110 (+) Transcript_23953:61-390(+)
MKFYSILVVTLSASNYASADIDGISMLRGILPHLKKMKDDGVVNLLVADDTEDGVISVDKKTDVFSGLDLEGCSPQGCNVNRDCSNAGEYDTCKYSCNCGSGYEGCCHN